MRSFFLLFLSQWEPVAALNTSAVLGGEPTLTPHMYTPIKRVSWRQPVKMTHTANGSVVFHFEHNFVGWVDVLNVQGPSGSPLYLAYGEQLRLDNGTVCLVDCGGAANASVVYPFGGQVDTLVLAGRGVPENFTSHFTYKGFQFVQVNGWPAGWPISLSSVRGAIVHSDNVQVR